jgi:hypothetical protein
MKYDLGKRTSEKKNAFLVVSTKIKKAEFKSAKHAPKDKSTLFLIILNTTGVHCICL